MSHLVIVFSVPFLEQGHIVPHSFQNLRRNISLQIIINRILEAQIHVFLVNGETAKTILRGRPTKKDFF